jgi:hypothetical protein
VVQHIVVGMEEDREDKEDMVDKELDTNYIHQNLR